ncbi:MAG: hypothetical protein LC624_09845 [Halobacteriales archaeon]|nr:hypothetical protein [Halobacteriales archaeon]
MRLPKPSIQLRKKPSEAPGEMRFLPLEYRPATGRAPAMPPSPPQLASPAPAHIPEAAPRIAMPSETRDVPAPVPEEPLAAQVEEPAPKRGDASAPARRYALPKLRLPTREPAEETAPSEPAERRFGLPVRKPRAEAPHVEPAQGATPPKPRFPLPGRAQPAAVPSDAPSGAPAEEPAKRRFALPMRKKLAPPAVEPEPGPVEAPPAPDAPAKKRFALPARKNPAPEPVAAAPEAPKRAFTFGRKKPELPEMSSEPAPPAPEPAPEPATVVATPTIPAPAALPPPPPMPVAAALPATDFDSLHLRVDRIVDEKRRAVRRDPRSLDQKVDELVAGKAQPKDDAGAGI